MSSASSIESLLADLQTINDMARAGVLSRRDEIIELGETRPAAMLFIDIVGFTELACKLPSEATTMVVDRAFRIFNQTVRANGGYCDKAMGVMGDAALYVFAGHPNYPPVCESALRAALKLRERVSQINESLKESHIAIAIRQGVSFGEVTRQSIGDPDARRTVIGKAVNLAQRLESSAAPGAIQTIKAVLDEAGDAFQTEGVGVRALKGIGEVEVYAVTGIEYRPVHLRGSFRKLTPHIGRDEEMSAAVGLIREWLRIEYARDTFDITKMTKLLADRNRMLVIRGEPAIGKSRFAFELAELLRKELGAAYATAHCAEYADLATFASELASLAELTAANLMEKWEDLCQNVADKVGREYAERQRRHVSLLGYLFERDVAGSSAVAMSDPKSFEIGCQLAVRACCELVAHKTGKPVVLIIEDIQWLGGLRDFLSETLARTSLPFPLIVIATARPEFGSGAEGIFETPSIAIELLPLPRSKADEIIQALLPGISLPAALLDELHNKASGVPYFYEDFVRMLIRRGLVEEKGGEWSLAHDIPELSIPEDIMCFMLSRLDMLAFHLHELVRRASVIGASFDRSILLAMDDLLGCLHVEPVEKMLNQLVCEDILVIGDGDNYVFEHVLLRDSAYSSLLHSNRRMLHSAAAQIFVSKRISGSQTELPVLRQIIYHLERSGRVLDAHYYVCDYLTIKASMMSYDDWSFYEERAIYFWSVAQDVVEQSYLIDNNFYPDSEALHLAIAVRLYRQGRYDFAMAHANAVVELSEKREDKKVKASAINLTGNILYETGKYEDARISWEDSLRLSRESNARQSIAVSLNNLATYYRDRGRFEQARDYFERSLRIFRKSGDKRAESMCLNNMGSLHGALGRRDQARDFYEDAVAAARAHGDSWSEGVILNSLGLLHREEGRYAQARDCFEDSIAIRREIGDTRGEGDSLKNLGELYLLQGRRGVGEKYIRDADFLLRELIDAGLMSGERFEAGLFVDTAAASDSQKLGGRMMGA